ncbi:rhomboid family intramembrane serine protease [Caulobacter mirabilis]|uniref:Rhomboid family intramembrane serine protease n=1 Tax=Caulobacter mirabilis TaxID=69666 RepID=A0A2D2AYH2_9CAUL|nr:rhomboid family intramembrane serine protease [Caulobacter mirabilis]ATQ43054.1 rhomboid family intramembrane serine protease [Caulobacter mirabilis]
MTEGRPWGAPTDSDPPRPSRRAVEPAFNFRWREAWGLALLLALIGATFAGQLLLRGGLGQPNLETLGALSRGTLAEGWWWTPFTAMFMHAGLLHLGMNLSAMIPFGLILARRFGPSARGQLAFIAFYLVAGLAGDAVYLALQPDPYALMVGASGAIFGLWGGVMRLGRDGTLSPAFSPQVLRQLGGPIVANVIVVLAFGLSGGGIAWQAHLGGFLVGWLGLGLFLHGRSGVSRGS